MLLGFYGPFYLPAVLLLVSLTGTHSECPVQLNPQRVVVRYGSSAKADCSTNVTHNGIGWEASEGAVNMIKTQNLITWRVSSLKRWDIQPICFINYKGQCESILPVTVYKTPDSVSIITVDHTKPQMTEGSTYKLHCDVVNVAPVQNLTVKWYKGEILVHHETFIDTIKTPVNKASILQITADRTDDGVQYRCEAELELGAEGPQPPLREPSERLNITVYYPPKHKLMTKTINTNGGKVTLNCTVAAKPAATYTWYSAHLNDATINSSVLLSSTLSSGNYTCTAENSLGLSRKVFIINYAGRGTFWAILLSGLGVLAILIISYTIYKCKFSQNSVI